MVAIFRLAHLATTALASRVQKRTGHPVREDRFGELTNELDDYLLSMPP